MEKHIAFIEVLLLGIFASVVEEETVRYLFYSVGIILGLFNVVNVIRGWVKEWKEKD
jgi:bacteriorhodopsin